MKTTLVLDDALLTTLREEARRRRMSMSRLVADALRRYLREPSVRRNLRPLPAFDAGVPRVDVNDRNALYDAMES